MKNLNGLEQKISNSIEGLTPWEADLETLKILYPYANELNILLTKETDLSIDLQNTSENLFVRWLNNYKKGNFYVVKEKMLQKELILQENFKPTSIEEYRKKFVLEYICSIVIRFFLDDERKLKQIPALKSKHKKIIDAMEFINTELNKIGTLPFVDSALQHLSQYCIHNLLKNPTRSIYSTGKIHPQLARELMVKRFMQLLYSIFREANLSNEFVLTTAIDLTAHFFSTPMDLKEAKGFANEIKQSTIRDNELMDKTVHDLLREYATQKAITY